MAFDDGNICVIDHESRASETPDEAVKEIVPPWFMFRQLGPIRVCQAVFIEKAAGFSSCCVVLSCVIK